MTEPDDSQSDVTTSGSFQPRRLVQNSRFGVVSFFLPSYNFLWCDLINFALIQVRLCSSLTCTEVIFLVVSTISLLSSFGLSIYKLVTVNRNEDFSDFIFAILIVFNSSKFFTFSLFNHFYWRLLCTSFCLQWFAFIMLSTASFGNAFSKSSSFASQSPRLLSTSLSTSSIHRDGRTQSRS